MRDLSRRERQLMSALYAYGPATVSEILERIPDPPSYSAVRATLRVLEDKGYVSHEVDGRRYLYRPTVATESARSAALAELVRTYFAGSAEQAAVALLRMSDASEARSTLERLSAMIERARREGR
jgi:predicted transcriptional regulator